MDFWRLARWVRNHQGRDLTDGDLVYVESGALRALAVGTTGQVLTAAPGASHKLSWAASSGGTSGGTSDHALLTDLRWSASGHTDTANRIAGFNGSSAASLYAIGSDLQAWDADLDAVAGLTFQGGAFRTGNNTWSLRTFVGPAAGLTITNPQGVGGNPTWALANDLSALEGLTGSGFAARTQTDGWALRALQGPAAGLTISNPQGIAGDPTFALANDLGGVEGLTQTGFAVRTATDTWATRSFSVAAGSTGLSVANGDGVAASPVFTLDPSAVYDAAGARFRQVVATTGSYTNVTIPSDAKYVRITCIGAGSDGQNGVTGDNTANRAGGQSGGGGAWSVGVWRREMLPSTIFCRPGARTTFLGTPIHTIVEAVNSGYTSSTLNNSAYIINYASSASGTGGNGASVPQLALGLKSALSFQSLAGGGGAGGGASGQPTDQTLFGTTTGAPTAAGCGGAGKNTIPTASNGGGWGAMGPFSARAGGTSPGGAGTDGIYGPSAGTWTSGSSNPYEFAWGYGGTGGASHTAGTGGKGGNGALGCGGGGGGAGTTAGGAGGSGGDGCIIVEAW